MRIGFISTMSGEPWGGSEELWSQAALRLVKNGSKVAASVWYWPTCSPQLQTLAQSGCTIHLRKPRHSLGHRLQRRLGLLRNEFAWLDRFQPDLVVISVGMHVDPVQVSAECRHRNLKYALLVHAATDHGMLNDVFLDTLREAYEGASSCFFVSQANQTLVETLLATQLKRARVVRNPYNVPYDAEPAWPSEEPTLRIACVARLDAMHKGHDLLFQVLRQEKWRKRALSLSLVGSSSSNERWLRRLSAVWDLKQIHFAGFAHDIQTVWSQHHALVLASRFEGLPLALVEAMLCARTCIVTDVGGNGELVQDEVNGFLAPAPTVNLVDATLERAWNRRDEWQELGRQAARTVRQCVPRDPVQVFIDELQNSV